MPALPTGTVTFLFTDVEGSSRRWDEQRAAMERALARHDTLLRAAADAHRGYVFHTAGDAFGVAFASPDDALAAALDAQRALAAEDWSAIAPGFAPLAVRMGLHTGLAELRDGDYFGPPLNRAARLMAAGHGGQVLLSLATQQLVRDRLPAGVTLRDLGAHRLKDLRFAEHIYQLIGDGLPDVARPPATAEALPARDRALVDADFLPPECPYRGLLAFRPEDARFFFGREAFTARLVAAMAAKPMVGVIGPSGSGKSSVVYAGLLPALLKAAPNGRADHVDDDHADADAGDGAWTVLRLRPGADPFDAIASVLVPHLEPAMSHTARLVESARLAQALAGGTLDVRKVVASIRDANAAIGRVLFVIDQFEELYTLCPDTRIQRAFQDLVFDAVHKGGAGEPGAVKLALTLRADFMGHATAYRPFADAIQDHNVILGPMNRAELTAAIVKPAELQGRAFESGLVERILSDVGEEAGQLPLLEFALTKLWEGQQSGWLTHEAYEAIGRVEGAVARHADAVFDGLGSTEQAGCRRVFVQMVRPGEGTEDTRRLATKDELGDDWPLVRRLADARLVVTNRDAASGRETVEVVHEALIRSWGLLTGWMNADRAFRTWQERVRFATRQWAATGEDEGALLRGVPLAEAEGWLAERGAELAAAERTYVDASVAQRARRETDEAARAARERRLERRGRRLMQGLLGGAMVAAIVSAALAVSAQRSATQARSLAQASGAQAYLSRGDTGRALALALEAVKGDDPPQEARRVLAEAAFAPGVRWEVRYPESAITDVAVSPDGTMVAAGLGDAFALDKKAPGLVLHDRATGALIRRFQGVAAGVREVRFSPDGDLLASTTNDGTLTLWDVSTGKPVHRMVFGENFGTAAFLGGGTRIASVADGHLVIWDVGTGRQLQEWSAGFFGLQVMPDGEGLITSGRSSLATGTFLELWREGKRVRKMEGGGSLAIMPDGERLAVNSTRNASDILVYRIADGGVLRTLTVGGADLTLLASGADQEALASGDYSGIIRLWNVSSGDETLRLSGHRSPVTALAFTPDDQGLVSGSNDGSLRLWDRFDGSVSWRVQVGAAGLGLRSVQHASSVVLGSVAEFRRVQLDGSGEADRFVFPADWPKPRPVSFDASADGRLGAVGYQNVGDVRNVRVLDLTTGLEAPGSPFTGDGGPMHGLHFVRDGTRLVGCTWGGQLLVWNVATGTQSLALNLSTTVGRSVQPTVLDVSADDQFALVGLLDGNAVVVNIVTGELESTLAAHSERISAVRFSPDGHVAMTGSNDRTAVVWDVASGRVLQRLEGHSGSIDHIDFSTDGRLALTAGGDGTVRVWDVATGEQLQSQSVPVDGVAFLPDGTGFLTTSPDGFLRSWRLNDDTAAIARWAFNNRAVPELSCYERRRFMVTDRCGANEQFPTRTPSTMVSEPTASIARVMALATPTASITSSLAVRTAVAQPAGIARAGRSLGSLATSSAQTWTFDAQAGTVLDVAVHAVHPADAVDDTAAQQAQGLLDTRLVIRDARGTLLAESEDVVTDRDTDAAVQNLVIAESGPLTLEVRSAFDATAGPFSLDVNVIPQATSVRRMLEPDPNRVQALVSPDGKVLLTLEDVPDQELRQVHLRNMADMSVMATFSITREFRPRQLYFSPDMRQLVGNVDDASGRILVLDARTGHAQRVIKAHEGTAIGVSFVPNRRHLLSYGADKLIRLWDLDTGAEIRRFVGHADVVLGAKASPDGRLVLSSGQDQSLRVWDMDNGQELRRNDRPGKRLVGVDVSADGRLVATYEGQGRSAAILVWSPETAAVVWQAPDPYSDAGLLTLQFSPVGRWLLTRTNRGLQLWDVASGREVSRLVKDATWSRARFAPDGRAVVALGVDGAVWWWDVSALR